MHRDKHHVQQSNNKKTGGVEALGERVFVTSPRMFSFTHRCTTSIRHPFVPAAIATLTGEAEQRAANKKGSASGAMTATAKAERMSEYFTDNAEGDKWKVVARMLDSVLFENDISHRRQSALEHASLRRALETWWCKAGGTPSKGITEESYKQIHGLLYRELLHVSDVCMHGIITKAISHDWQWDSDGTGEVGFGKWYVSMLEIADNWVPACDGEHYGVFLTELAQRIFQRDGAGVAASPSAAPLHTAVDEYQHREALVESLRRNARLYRNDKLIQKHWSARHTVVYAAIDDTL